MSMIPIKEKVYDDGRTKQSFKDATDVNKLIQKAARTGTLSHLDTYGGQYGDFSDFDFMEAQNQLAQAKTIFEALPAEVRREFGQNPANFFEYANDPDNVENLKQLLPAIAKPGSQLPRITGEPVEAAQPQKQPKVEEKPTPDPEKPVDGA